MPGTALGAWRYPVNTTDKALSVLVEPAFHWERQSTTHPKRKKIYMCCLMEISGNKKTVGQGQEGQNIRGKCGHKAVVEKMTFG